MAIYLLPLTLAFGVSQLLAGYVGIAEYLGPAWAIGLLAASLLFRFTLPITIGAFFGAMDVWGNSLVSCDVICCTRTYILSSNHHCIHPDSSQTLRRIYVYSCNPGSHGCQFDNNPWTRDDHHNACACTLLPCWNLCRNTNQYKSKSGCPPVHTNHAE